MAYNEPIETLRRLESHVKQCLAVVAYPVRRPGRTAAIVLLLAIIGAGAWAITVQIGASADLRAARADVEHAHNRQAQVHLEAYRKVWPRDPDALLLAARTARRMGAFQGAEDFLDQYESVRGKDDDNLILERVLLQAQRGRVDRVRDYCAAHVRDNQPDAPLVLEAVTAGLMRDYRVFEANDRIELWLKLRPDDPQALLVQGTLFDLESRPTEAIANYRKAVELDPDNEDARLRLAADLLQDHEGGEALPHLEYLQKRRPEDARVLVRLVQCRLLLGQTDEAKRLLDGVLARQPHNPEALAMRGKLARQDGDLAEAEKWLREAVAADPGAYEARYHLYLCLNDQGKEADAKEQLARLNVMDEDNKEIQEIIGGKMQRTPNDPELHYKAGMIALRSGATAEGVRWLESALELDPKYAPAHKTLALYYEQIGDLGRAAQHNEMGQTRP
jgi:tetratricopeptide (TPR) repeat protein